MWDTSNSGRPLTTLVLDNPDAYAMLDPSGLRCRLRDLPLQCRDAWAHCDVGEISGRPYQQVVIGGMGGSAIAGDLVVDLAALRPSIPITLVRDFSLPLKLDAHSLFISCSFSGATQETLSLYRQARDQGASLLAVTGGGPLAEEARTDGAPVLRIGTRGEPRSAVGYSLMLLLKVLDQLGLLSTTDDEVAAAVAAAQEQVQRCHEEVPCGDNPAKQLAHELAGRLVVVYGGGLFSALARRWKTQLNENAKVWAFFEAIPELLHNSVEALPRPLDGGMVLVLQPGTDNPQLESRFRAVSELLKEANIPHRVLRETQGPPLAQLLSLLVLGDYVSYYLALLQGLDPAPTPAINRGKELLSKDNSPP
jgi:glucose/mannose-6-phosphate isomerase